MSINKKGISPLIATILLVGFAIAVLAIAFLWARGYIEEKAAKEGKLAEKQFECEDIEFTITSIQVTGSSVRVALKNLKDKNIDKLTFRIEGDSKSDLRNEYVSLEGLEVKPYEVEFDSSKINDPTKVSVIPWINVAPGYYLPCSNKFKTALV
ncbi:MAG: hypothetical protein PHE43_03415 [Candidatus Nanoarchaeia archaeon]|nr:hypothetical protein [Candidatus Nanoarchaeia archaeon]